MREGGPRPAGIEQLAVGDKNGWLPIHHAALDNRDVNVVRLLLDAGRRADWPVEPPPPTCQVPART